MLGYLRLVIKEKQCKNTWLLLGDAYENEAVLEQVFATLETHAVLPMRVHPIASMPSKILSSSTPNSLASQIFSSFASFGKSPL